MSHTETRQEVDEWTVEVCDNCGHDEAHHYNEPKEIYGYVWSGCIVLAGNRILPGINGGPNNPYPRCNCTEFV